MPRRLAAPSQLAAGGLENLPLTSHSPPVSAIGLSRPVPACHWPFPNATLSPDADSGAAPLSSRRPCPATVQDGVFLISRLIPLPLLFASPSSFILLLPLYQATSNSLSSLRLSIHPSSPSPHQHHILPTCLPPPTSSRSPTCPSLPLAARRSSSPRMRCLVSWLPVPSTLPTSLSPVPALLAAFT